MHSVSNDQKLGPAGKPLFDSGALQAGRHGYVFAAAGTYIYRSTVSGDGKFAGSVAVPVVVSPASGKTTTRFTLIWASRTISGYVFDIEIRYLKTGSKVWSPWAAFKTGTTAVTGTTTTNLAAGRYEVHARLRNLASGKASGWSPAMSAPVAQ